MRYRRIRGVGAPVSELAFGCGPGAGLMVGDDRRAQVEAVTAALEGGVTLFDTAALYGGGRSETALGEALGQARAGEGPVVLTKIALRDEDREDIVGAVRCAVEASCRRLGREAVDVVLLHNRIGPPRDRPGAMPPFSVAEVVGERGVAEGFRQVQAAGLATAWGFATFGGDPAEVGSALDACAPQVINATFNLLNPSAGAPVPPVPCDEARFDATPYDQLIDRAGARGVATVALQPLAGGVLGKPGGPAVLDDLRDMAAARGATLVGLAAAFCLAKPEVASLVWGLRSAAQVRSALDAVETPPLTVTEVEALLDRVAAAC